MSTETPSNAQLIERTLQLVHEARELLAWRRHDRRDQLNTLASSSERVMKSRALLAKIVHDPIGAKSTAPSSPLPLARKRSLEKK